MTVPISTLLASDSPRLTGEDSEHTRTLAESAGVLPPILVNRATMRVIDGMHRLRAVMLRGEDEIQARFFDGDEVDAFVLGVTANIVHGLPLSLADRKAAAKRIINARPQWSDRKIASTTGLAPNTIGAIRRCLTVQNVQLDTRVGQDGRVRPVNSMTGRKLASELIAEKPDASLREIAEVAGISPETVRNVREQMRRGEGSVPSRQRGGDRRDDHLKSSTSTKRLGSAIPARRQIENRALIVQNLKKDPSLRFSEAGRVLLRLLDAHTIGAEEWDLLVDNVPAHCGNVVLILARECADTWQDFVGKLEQRSRTTA